MTVSDRTTKRGRKPVHADARARKRAYYERHAEREREKARDRWRRNRAQAIEREDEAQRVLALEQGLMPRTAKVTRATMSINEYTRLPTLALALAEDLRTWGLDESLTTDRARFRSLTKTAIRLYEADKAKCKEAFEKLVEGPLTLVKCVQKLARFAASLAECRNKDTLFRRLDAIALAATTVRLGLEEMLELFCKDPSTLRSKQVDKLLHWQL